MDASATLAEQLFAAGLMMETGVDGLYALDQRFESVVEAFDALVTRTAAKDGAEVVRFPPGMARQSFEKSGYLKSFPQLAGTVHAFCGDDAAHAELLAHAANGEDWTGAQAPTEVVLTPAACYPLYPLIARRGDLPAGGGLFDVRSWCFRHEPSKDPARLQLFRMREFVRAGTSEEVLAFRARWLERGQALIASLDIPYTVDVANDPFFGRAGRMLKVNQRDQGLKFELLTPINPGGLTACLSFNYHQTHFGETWGLRTASRQVAHTACVGFGLERVALALLRHHGFEPQAWPESIRRVLSP